MSFRIKKLENCLPKDKIKKKIKEEIIYVIDETTGELVEEKAVQQVPVEINSTPVKGVAMRKARNSNESFM